MMIRRLHLVLSFLPSLWLMFLWTFVLRAYFLLGYWPHYGHPDPSQTNMIAHAYALMYSFFAGLVAIVVWVIVTPIIHKRVQKKVVMIHAFIFILLILLSLLQLTLDPGGVVELIID